MSENTCRHPDGVAGAHGLPGTRNAADHDTKQRFEAAVCWYMAKHECDQSTAINLILDAARKWEKTEAEIQKAVRLIQGVFEA
jgi:hypothetical protein